VAFALVAAVAVAGCGGSGNAESTASSKSPSRTAFIAKADAICKQLDVELANPKPKSTSFRELALLVPHRAALEQAAVTELRRLTPPSSFGQEWREIIAYRQALAEELAKLGQSAKAKDAKAIKAISLSKIRMHRLLRTLAARNGFAYCGQIA